MSTTETLEEFVKLVRSMRMAQEEYFKTRGHHDLLLAKKHEGLVDGFINELDKKDALKKQPGLFGGMT